MVSGCPYTGFRTKAMRCIFCVFLVSTCCVLTYHTFRRSIVTQWIIPERQSQVNRSSNMTRSTILGGFVANNAVLDGSPRNQSDKSNRRLSEILTNYNNSVSTDVNATIPNMAKKAVTVKTITSGVVVDVNSKYSNNTTTGEVSKQPKDVIAISGNFNRPNNNVPKNGSLKQQDITAAEIPKQLNDRETDGIPKQQNNIVSDEISRQPNIPRLEDSIHTNSIAKDGITKQPAIATNGFPKKQDISAFGIAKVEKIVTERKVEASKSPVELSKKQINPDVTRTENAESEDACQFPVQDPTHPMIMKYFQKYPDIECKSRIPSVVCLDGNTLKLNSTKALLQNIFVDYCQYTVLTLSEKSDSIVHHSYTSQPFTNSTDLPIEFEHFIVYCYHQSVPVAETYFSVIRKKPSVEEECETSYKQHVEEHSPQESLSILLVGFDGTSRQNLIRTMPKTRHFILSELDAIEMYKFNKVGDNTFPNVIAMLSGNSEEDVLKRWSYKVPLDTIEDIMLWKEYREAGYRTAMLLDSVEITSFHFAKKGWTKTPWDYYFRPLVIELKNRVDKHCIGDKPELAFHLDYWLQLTSVFNNSGGGEKNKPYFAYSFNQRMQHNDGNKAMMADKLFLEFFQTLVRRNVINNTVVVFFSDHGARFGPIRQIHPGILESRTPFIFFMFPSWFHAKYPHIMRTMRTNQRRLTTMFDVHATLKELLYFKGTTGVGELGKRGISLFKEIPKERMCPDAGIPIEYCMCSKQASAPAAPEVAKEMAELVANKIRFETLTHRSICHPLELAEVMSAMTIQGDIRCKYCLYYGVTIKMTPGGGIFEATVEHNKWTNRKQVINSAIRLNMYHDQADCMPDGKLKSFCLCKNWHG